MADFGGKYGEVCAGDDWSSLAFLRVLPDLTGDEEHDEQHGHIPAGYVFVIQENVRQKGMTPQWKFPGGHKEHGETPLETAEREIGGETYLDPETIVWKWIASEWQARARTPHWKIYFTGDVRFSKTKVMCPYHSGNEGEQPKLLTVDEFYGAVRTNEFLHIHYDFLIRKTLILPLGRDKQTATN